MPKKKKKRKKKKNKKKKKEKKKKVIRTAGKKILARKDSLHRKPFCFWKDKISNRPI